MVSKDTAKIRLSYSKRYAYVLTTSNAEDLLSLSDDMRANVMKSLASLSKYLGCYDIWKNIRERYQLKWSNEDSIEVFNNILNSNHDLSSMINWIKKTCSVLPSVYSNLLLFDSLTGLRADEACRSISLIKNDPSGYLNKELMILEHYKHPAIFIRRTKKAYVSIVDESIVDLAKKSSNNYNALRLTIRRRGLEMHMAYCRKIFATFLRIHGHVELETVDLLEGRIPKSVFVRHYLKLGSDDITRIRESIRQLAKEIGYIG